MKNLYKLFIDHLHLISWLIVAVPFLIGALLSVVWFYIQSDTLELLLVVILSIGFWALAIGFLLILLYAIEYRHTNGVGSKVVKLIGFYIFVIIVTLFLFIGATSEMTKSTITIKNKSNYYIKEAYLIGAHHNKINLSTIEPKSTKIVTTHFGADDSIDYVVIVDSTVNRGTLFGYVTVNSASEGEVIIYSDKTVHTNESLKEVSETDQALIFHFDDNISETTKKANDFTFEKTFLDLNKSKKKHNFKF